MPASPTDPRLPIWARPPALIGIVLALLALKLWVSGATNLVFDEGYYTLWSLHLSASYLDHPPAVAFMIALGRLIAGDTELGVRLMAVLSDAVIAAALYRMGHLLFDARTAAVAVIWHTVSIAAALTFVTTPDAPSILFWTLALWAIAEFIESDNRAWWLAAGIFAGLGLTAKLTNLMLAPGLLLLVLSSAERRQWLKLWEVWAGAGLALVVFSPVIAWNAAHDWNTFWFQGRRTVGAAASANGFLGNFGEMLGAQILAVGLPAFCFAIAAALVLAMRRAGAARNGLALLVITPLPLVVYFLVHATHSRIEANWLLPIWPGLVLAAAWAAMNLRPANLMGRVAALGRALQVPLQAVLIAVIFIQALYFPFPSVAFDRTRDLYGFREIYGHVRQQVERTGARWIVNVDSYGVTGQLAAYARFAGDATPVHQLQDRLRYRFRPPLDAGALGWPAVFVASVSDPANPVPPANYFNRAELLEVVPRKRGDEVLEFYQIYLVSEPTDAFMALAGT